MKTEHIAIIKNAFKNLPEHWLLLFVIDTEDYLEKNIAILNEVLKQEDAVGVYVTLNRPYSVLIKILEKNNINTDKLFFIDCITKTIEPKKEEKKCLFLENPQNLTNIAIAIDEIMSTISSKNKSLFVDTMSTLLIYNGVEMVSKFMHVLTGKIRVLNLNGVLLSTEKELDPGLDDQLNLLVDKTVDLSK
jgi:cystathionine beta-lyase/cystathionine gamma-synthase